MSSGADHCPEPKAQEFGVQLQEASGSSQSKLDAPVRDGYSNLIIDTDRRLSLIISSHWQRRTSARIASTSQHSSMVGRGSLTLFMNLPLDLTFEIAKYLHFSDLLTFVRLNKRFRAVFLRRSASPVWRQCIANSPIPPCPPDMTEPQYASFMLTVGAFCMACGYNVSSKLKSYPTLRLRLCANCKSTNLINGRTLSRDQDYDPDQMLSILSIIPCSDSQFKNGKSLDLWQASSFSYFKPEAEIIFAAYKQAKEDGNLDEFLEHRRSVREAMTAQGKAMAAHIDPRVLATQRTRSGCCIRRKHRGP